MKILTGLTKNPFYKYFTFAAGESHLVLTKEVLSKEKVDIEFNFFCVADIFELLLLAHTLQINKIAIRDLIIPYMPFGQADRINEAGECFSLKLFCDLINNIVRPEQVTVYDPHSDVTPALLNNCYVIPQYQILGPIINNDISLKNNSCILICPDAGATKKINKLAKHLHGYIKLTIDEIVLCEKIRNTLTGEITSTKVYCSDLQGRDCVIVDDICVGGRTFIEIAKILRSRNAGSIILVTTNGCYSAGFEPFDGLIDQIWNRKGRIK